MSHVFAHAVKHSFEHAHQLEPVGKGKSPVAAFVIGVLLGPIGAGIYLGSVIDFIILAALLVIGTLFTGGLAAPVFWVICGAWAAYRVNLANKPDAGHR